MLIRLEEREGAIVPLLGKMHVLLRMADKPYKDSEVYQIHKIFRGPVARDFLGHPLQSKRQLLIFVPLATREGIMTSDGSSWVVEAVYLTSRDSTPSQVTRQHTSAMTGAQSSEGLCSRSRLPYMLPSHAILADHMELEVSAVGRHSMESMANPHGRITMKAHGVLEQGHAICRRESHAFRKTAPGMLLGPGEDETPDHGTRSNHATRIICHKLGLIGSIKS